MKLLFIILFPVLLFAQAPIGEWLVTDNLSVDGADSVTQWINNYGADTLITNDEAQVYYNSSDQAIIFNTKGYLELKNGDKDKFEMDGTDWSIEIWILCPNISVAGATVNKYSAGASSRPRWYIYLTTSEFVQVYLDHPTNTDISQFSTVGIGTGTWRHVVVVGDVSDSLTIYFDNAKNVSNKTADWLGLGDMSSQHTFALGGTATGAYPLPAGIKISSVRYYDRALSLTDIATLYTAGKTASYADAFPADTETGKFKKNSGWMDGFGGW